MSVSVKPLGGYAVAQPEEAPTNALFLVGFCRQLPAFFDSRVHSLFRRTRLARTPAMRDVMGASGNGVQFMPVPMENSGKVISIEVRLH